MKTAALLAFLISGLFLTTACGGDAPAVKRVLFFSKAASWEQKIIHRDHDELSYIEQAVQTLGQENRIEFTFTKDGTVFTAENLAKFDAFFFYTSGDMTFQQRTGRGDNYPLMTLEGKKAFLDAIRNGKGFIGCNTAVYTFIDPFSPGETKDEANAARYTRMIGGGYIGHNEVQEGRFSHLDRRFPGMEKVPADYRPVDQWYAFKNLMSDLHVIMALDSGKLTGNLYERPSYPIAWARMEGRGRVYYTTMGHTAEIWQDPVFLQMLLGGLRWTTGSVDADVTADAATVTPQANEIPPAASKFVPSHPSMTNAHFPNFKVWLDQEYPTTDARKRVLVFTKSAGYEHPVVYRDTAWPSFLESELLKLGQEHGINFVFSKDGTIFTPENLAGYDAILCYTSGDPTEQPRNGQGDNYPLMTQAGKQALLDAIRKGKGFIGVHSAIDLFGAGTEVLGAQSAGGEQLQKGALIQVDKTFPGMEAVPADFAPIEEWYSFQHFQPDLRVLLALDCSKMAGDRYRRPSYPVAWARMEGQGRVYYTSLGHSEEDWKSPGFQQMILGAIRWSTHLVDADLTPTTGEITKPSKGNSDSIDIDVGRQLFVDDYLVADGPLKRTFHQAKLYADAPVLKAETELETKRGTAEGAVLFDGGVWFDPQDQLFKMWYAGGFRDGICYATSKDGLHWERPVLNVSPGENRVLPYQKGWELSGFSVALDQFTSDSAQRFKMLAYHRYKNRFPGDPGEENPPAKMYVSTDGIHWGEPQMVKAFTGDNVSMFYDPFRKYWVFSTRNRAPSVLHPNATDAKSKPVTVRARFRFDGPDFIQTGLTASKALLWLKPDERDKPDPELGIDPELYKFGAVAYESIMLGAYGIFYGPQNDVAGKQKRPKIIDIQLGFSRDGVTYPRPSREAFIAASRQPGTWNRGYLHSANGVCLIVGEELWFYFGAWSGLSQRENAEYLMAGGSVGLAKLRRDGFASMDAGKEGGTLTTAPVIFHGKFPFVNIAAQGGELRAEMLDAEGKVIAPFTAENSVPIKTDSTRARLAWKGADDLSSLAGKPVRFRFHVTDAQLYAFWVSQSAGGASNGYVAAGGPGLMGPIDR